MKRVILIAGHNGKGTGANGFIDEGEETIVLRDLIAEELRVRGIVHITDKEREKEKLAAIVTWIKSIFRKSDICVDLHFNAASTPTATGCEVLIPSKFDATERNLATELSNYISNTLGIKNRGVKTESQGQHTSLAMLSGFDCTNILIEVCFVSNKEDAKKYFAKREELAAGIAQILYQYVNL